MRGHTIGRLASMIAIVGGLAGVGFGVAPASATATTGSAAGLEPPISVVIKPGPGVRVTGDCPSSLFQDIGFFDFVSGNYVFYGPSSGNSGGFNVEGDATLTFLGSDSIDAVFEGHTHLWANQNYNPTGNGQQYFGITGSFNGTGIDGTVGSLSITASGGETTSASGHVSGWGHFNVTCSGFPS